MAKTIGTAPRQEDLTERRRSQILSAARACVLADGFHATTIDRIAAVASMSHGQIYKYFENKEAIMLALSEGEFNEFMLHIARLNDQTDLSVDMVIRLFQNEMPWVGDRAALALAVLAEAGRNIKVSEMVMRFERRVCEAFRRIIVALLGGLTERQIEVRVELLLVMWRGLAIHAGTNPSTDPRILSIGFERALRGALS